MDDIRLRSTANHQTDHPLSWMSGKDIPLVPDLTHLRLIPGQVNTLQRREASSATSRHSLRKTIDHLDNGCIITNVRRHMAQLAHVFNAQRSDQSRKKKW